MWPNACPARKWKTCQIDLKHCVRHDITDYYVLNRLIRAIYSGKFSSAMAAARVPLFRWHMTVLVSLELLGSPGASKTNQNSRLMIMER